MERCVTIVCCYNDREQYERLRRSLERQRLEHELIGIDNCGQKFASCSSALNSVMDEIKTEYVIYSHQDIELPEPDMLGQFVAYMEQMQAGDILGVAGAVENPGKRAKNMECVISNVRHGAELITAGEREFAGMTACDTVDECFFGGRTECFRRAPFDEGLCDNWHLYAVERCLYARVHGNRVYVCDLPLLHHSSGKINRSYNQNFYRIAKVYAKKLDCIRTVCGSARTDWIHRSIFFLKREILIGLHRF